VGKHRKEHPESADDLARQVDEVTGALDVLARVLEQEEELPVVLDRLCRQAVHAIGEADLASVVLLRGGTPVTSAVTHDAAGVADQAQYRAAQGPCLEVAATGEVVRASPEQVAARWPGLAAESAGTDIASYLSAPLFIDTEHHGSLNLYSYGAHGFDAIEAALLELYITAVEAALANAQRYRQAREQATQLGRALKSRGVIDQAKGILMAARRISADAAFTLLVSQSQQQNRKLHEVAQRFVTDVTSSGL
jgi:GAF domain-containing protein